MKKIICFILVFVLVSNLTGCSGKRSVKPYQNKIYGVWFSYSELDSMLMGGNFKDAFSNALENCELLGITDVFIHTRPFCDSIYPSKYFPLRRTAKSCDFDILSYMTEACHNKNIRIHAWINPYRVRTGDSSIDALDDESPAKKWLSDSDSNNDVNVSTLEGIYLNPTSTEVKKLIINGISEIVGNYNVDGIHFDDYFYPTQSEEFDGNIYKSYAEQSANSLPLDEWRRANVSALISSVKSLLADKGIIFSISPAADIEKNKSGYYADIEDWIKNGYVDWIIPQLYFGFNYPDKNFCFDKLFIKWQEFSKVGASKLIIGLASYKIDTDKEIESEEWSSGELLSREIDYSNKADGFCFFSYSSLFGNSTNQIKEREKISHTISEEKAKR